MSHHDHAVRPGKSINLSDWPTDATGNFKHRDAAAEPTAKNLEHLATLQEKLYAQGQHALLIVLQAMDCGGKDGTIRHVFGGVNPQGCAVTSFKVPSHLELAHDFLWRIHAAAPAKGMIGIFNRSHYESVLVERVHKLVPRDVWHARYEHINAFEKMLADEGTTILKFFLHISKKEQKARLEARLDHADTHWKFDPNDLNERKRWPEYQSAYADLLEKCSTKAAPWYIVPSDHKWYRNWFIGETIVKAMKQMDLKYPPTVAGLDKIKVK